MIDKALQKCERIALERRIGPIVETKDINFLEADSQEAAKDEKTRIYQAMENSYGELLLEAPSVRSHAQRLKTLPCHNN